MRLVANIDAPLATAGDCSPTAHNPHPLAAVVAARSERVIHLWPTLYLFVSQSQCLGDGVEDLLVCSGNM